MNKAQAINTFWKSFGLPAYNENTVPEEAVMPYITYSFGEGSLEDDLPLTGSLWYYSNSWEAISLKAEAISKYIGRGGKVIKIDEGYVWIKRGTPFSSHMDDINPAVRRIVININAEFLTEN